MSANPVICVNKPAIEAWGAFAQEREVSGLTPPHLASGGFVESPMADFVRSENQRPQFVEPYQVSILGPPISHTKWKDPSAPAKRDLPGRVPPTV
jgi:hypothetical protein